MDNWDFGRNGLHINRGARHLGQLYSRFCGIGGGRQKKRSELQCLAVGLSSEGTCGETGMTTIQEHLTSAWRTADDTVTTNPAKRKAEDEAKDECLAATVAPMIEIKPLVFCR
jgi:hypothetical protein